MKSKNLLFILFFPFLISSLNLSSDTKYKKFEFGTPFILDYKQLVQNEEEEILLKFNSVLSDSRCPSGVECVWAGEAELQFVAYKSNDSIKFNLSSSGKRFGQDTILFDLHVKLLQVIPYPEVLKSIAIEDYMGEVVIEKVIE